MASIARVVSSTARRPSVLVWAVASAGFGIYVANFGNYTATYGALGGVILLLTWFWLSAFVVLLGIRHPGAQKQLAAIAVDVDGEQSHRLLVEACLRCPHRRVERGGHGLGAALL
jgi:hypothetical protein